MSYEHYNPSITKQLEQLYTDLPENELALKILIAANSRVLSQKEKVILLETLK